MTEKKYTLTVAQNGFILNTNYKSWVFVELDALGRWLAEDVKPKNKLRPEDEDEDIDE